MYHTYISICNYANVPSKSKYIHCNAVSTSDKRTAYVSDFPYSEIVGSVLYSGDVSTPDIMCAVGVLTCHLQHPTYPTCKDAYYYYYYCTMRLRLSLILVVR